MESPNDDRALPTKKRDRRRGLTVMKKVIENKSKGAKRGLTLMKKVIESRSKGEKLEVGWNKRGQPIEPNASQLVSFIGVTVRQMVPISCHNWRAKTMKVIKDDVWKEIQTAFVVDDTHSNFILKEAGKLHRAFRTLLAKKYLRDADGNINDHPPKKYACFISEKDWRAFIAKRTSDSYQELSSVNRERASNSLYPYRKSRMGYARLEQKMLQETGSEHTTMPRRLLWKAGRENKAGVIDNENAHKVVEECEVLAQSLSDAEEGDYGRRDILAQVLNVPENPGKVRGVGFGVSQRDYFPPQKRAKREDIERLNATMDIVLARLKKLEDKHVIERQTPDSSIPSANDSCNPASHSLSEGAFPCQLYLSFPRYRVVGQGKVFNNPGDEVDTQELPPGYIKVKIMVAIEPNAPLPVSIDDDDCFVVRDAIGAIVAWPVNLVEMGVLECQKIPAKSKQIDKEVGHYKDPITIANRSCRKLAMQEPSPAVSGLSLPPHCSSLDSYVRVHMRAADLKKIEMEEGIFGYSFEEDISKNEINELLHNEIIGASVVNVYVRYLYDQLICPLGLRNRFSFVDPHVTSFSEANQGRKIANILLKNNEKDKLIFAPYNIEKHWVLIAINATSGIIYYMDSLHGDYRDYKEMEDMFNTALQIYRSKRRAKVSKSKSSNITWKKIECPRQTNNIDCGYYVMRFMKEIITENQTRIPVNYIPDYKCISYSQDKLIEVKEEWSRYVLENVIAKEKTTQGR